MITFRFVFISYSGLHVFISSYSNRNMSSSLAPYPLNFRLKTVQPKLINSRYDTTNVNAKISYLTKAKKVTEGNYGTG
jgi:hypothetical protein